MTALPCNNQKALYHDKQIAEAMAKRQGSLNGYPLYVYWCAECHGWHLSEYSPEEYQKWVQARVSGQSPPAKPAPPRYPPGYWTRMRMSEAERLAKVAHEKHVNYIKKQINRVNERWKRWRGCLILAPTEHAQIKSLESPVGLRERATRLRRELDLARAELAVLRGQIQRIDSAWLDRGRYVKSDVIEEALREFHSREAS